MRNKALMALLLAAALVIAPVGGSLTSFGVSAAESASGNGTETQDPSTSGNGTETQDPSTSGNGTETQNPSTSGNGTGTQDPTDPGTQDPTNPDVSGNDQPGTQDPAGDTIDDILNTEVTAENVETVVEKLVENKDELTEESLIDSVDKVEDIEKAYIDKKGLQETAKNVTAAGFDANQIKVVGAALSLEGDVKQATLNVEATAQSAVGISAYSKALLVEINLGGLTLKFPVVITMPVPSGMAADKVVVLHYVNGTENEATAITTVNNGDGTVSFAADSFSVFAFVESDNVVNVPVGPSCGSDDDDDDNGGSGSGAAATVDVEAAVKSAAKGATVKVTGVNTLSNGAMKALLARKDVTLVLEYTYNGKAYVVTIPAGAAVDNDIPWYGPLYLAGHYGSSAVAGSGSVYVVKAGDTMSKIAKANNMTLSQLAARNSQIKDINRIRVGEKINL